MEAIEKPKQKYFDPLDMPLFEEPVRIGFDPDWPKGDDDEREQFRQMWEDDIARSIWLVIGRWYLKSQHFLPDCIRVAQMLHWKAPQDTVELLQTFARFCEDSPLRNPFSARIPDDLFWYERYLAANPGDEYYRAKYENLIKPYRASLIKRELRPRELLAICQGRAVVRWVQSD